MDENLAGILKESNKIISKLQLLAVFFEEEIIYKIFLRSQVIHRLFENNAELDVHKLELFHLQFTTTIIELLRKIKRTNEQNVSLLYEEVRINEELIASLRTTFVADAQLKEAEKKQAQKLGISLRKLYQVLDEESDDYPFSNNIHTFSNQYAAAHFDNISADELKELTHYQPQEVYTHPHAVIHRRLLGTLAKNQFQLSFIDGLKAGSLALEVYRIANTDRYFIFLPSENIFLPCELADIDKLEGGGSATKKDRIVQSLISKNIDMESRAGVLKTELPADVHTLLADYYAKIGNAEFLQTVANFDVQANILRAMLNTDLL